MPDTLPPLAPAPVRSDERVALACQGLHPSYMLQFAGTYLAHLGGAVERCRAPNRYLEIPPTAIRWAASHGIVRVKLSPAAYPENCVQPENGGRAGFSAADDNERLCWTLSESIDDHDQAAADVRYLRIGRIEDFLESDVLDAVQVHVNTWLRAVLCDAVVQRRLGACAAFREDGRPCGSRAHVEMDRAGRPVSPPRCDACEEAETRVRWAEAARREREARASAKQEAAAMALARSTGDAFALDGRAEDERALANLGCGHVYVLHDAASGLTKIGKAKRLWSRCATLLTSATSPWTLVHAIPQQHTHLGRLESALHAQFQGRRLSGEWFLLEDADLEAIRTGYPEPVSATIAHARQQLAERNERFLGSGATPARRSRRRAGSAQPA